ncbi:MAG: hypothetical protein J3K34DRAFT_426972 [Monoraphidium minutum]|nr:MAG: hypothetical protein J3K34DRAFT_426972 [Monoraphidium minutum]
MRILDLQRPQPGQAYIPVAAGGNGGGGAEQVSVVIMNWAKPDSVRQIAASLAAMAAVGEVLVLHLRQDTTFEFEHPKVSHIVDYNADVRYGLTSRFLGCLHARHEAVVLQDDDVMLTEAALASLLAARAAAPAAPLVGLFGRDWPGDAPGYVMADVGPGRHPVALTVAALASRRLCHAFFEFSHLAEPFVRAHSAPYWNGEDIFLSLVGWKVAGEMPLIVAPPQRGYKLLHSHVSGAEGMHTTSPNHAAFRDALVKVAVKLLNLPTRGNGPPLDAAAADALLAAGGGAPLAAAV